MGTMTPKGRCGRCKKELRPDENNQVQVNILHLQPQTPEIFKILVCNNCCRQLTAQLRQWIALSGDGY